MFSERLNKLFSDVFDTTSGEFAKTTGYDRSYISHLRNGDRVLKQGHASADKLILAVCSFAETKGVCEKLHKYVNARNGASSDELSAAVGAWLFEDTDAGAEKQRYQKHDVKGKHLKSNFGTKLALVMEIADVSSSKLARFLNVDPSLVIKFKSGIRVPRENHPIIREMSVLLTDHIFTLDRIAALAELLNEPADELSDRAVCSSRLESWLRDFSVVDPAVIAGFLEGIDSFRSEASIPVVALENAANEDLLSDNAETYEGTEGLRRAVLRFLGNAVKNKEKELWLYSDQSLDWMISDKSFFLKWASLMSAYVRGGGKILIIHNVDRGLEDMIAAIQSWMPLYVSGLIDSRYCLRRGGERFSHTFFIAPQSACVSAVCVCGKEKEALYRYTTEDKGLSHYCVLFRDLLSESRPLISINSGDNLWYVPSMLNEKCVHLAGRSLSLGTMPESLLKRILDRSGLSDDIKKKIFSEWASKRELITEKCAYGEIHECIPAFEKQELSQGGIAVDTLHAELYYTQSEYEDHEREITRLSEREKGYRVHRLKDLPFEHIKLVVSNHAATIISTSGNTISFTVSHPLMCLAFNDFVKKLEEGR
ncbi:MAG: hypothetical protein IJS65_07330 [Clostridia bacterium]|nr:hypothetical protein [Clostridia bacterium]